jgi:hypothetical protein
MCVCSDIKDIDRPLTFSGNFHHPTNFVIGKIVLSANRMINATAGDMSNIEYFFRT